MRLYEGTITEFKAAVVKNELADKISSNYEYYFHRGINPSEYRSWQQSLNYLKNSFVEGEAVTEYKSLLNIVNVEEEIKGGPIAGTDFRDKNPVPGVDELHKMIS